MPFIHLRTHTEFSVVDGMLRIDALATAARADGQGAVAISDLNNLFGTVKSKAPQPQANFPPPQPASKQFCWLDF